MRGNQGDLFEQEPRNHCVYYHRSYKKGVFYIGLGLPNRPFDKLNRNRHWKNFVKKYGDYEIVILEDELTFKEAAALEIDAIKFVGINRLTNISHGGEAPALGMRHSEESKRKISQNSASKRPEIKAKYKEIFTGSGNPMFGRTHSIDAREKIRKARTGLKASDEVRLKMSNNRKGILNSSYDPKIFKFIKNSTIIECSCFHFQTMTGVDQASISMLKNGKRKSAKGWKIHEIGSGSSITC